MTTPTELLTDRIPPHSLEAERAILGVALLDPAAPAQLMATLAPDHFYKEAHRKIFAAVSTLGGASMPVDLITLVDTLRQRDELEEVGGASYVAQLLEEAATLTGLSSYVAIIREKAARRTGIRLGAELICQGYAEDGGGALAITKKAEQAVETLRRATAAPAAAELLGEGLGVFLARKFVDEAPLVEGLLTSDGNGWIAGEEKLGKTFFALEEALALSLGQPVAGRFPVPERRRVLFIEEEDPPRRAHTRLAALLRGRGLNPDDPFFQDELDAWIKVEIWSGFSLDDPSWIARLDATCAAFRPAIVYLDVLRKLTQKDLNKAPEAGALLANA